MRKLGVVLILVLSLSILILGCGGNDETPTQEVKAPEAKGPIITAIVNINDISNKTQDEVKAILGEPDSTSEVKFQYEGQTSDAPNSYDNTYKGGEVEVFFIEDVAARITITPLNKYTITDSSYEAVLPLLGLKSEAAYAYKPDIYVKWNNTQGLFEITAFIDTGNISYIYVITDAKYK